MLQYKAIKIAGLRDTVCSKLSIKKDIINMKSRLSILINSLAIAKANGNRYLWWFPHITKPDGYNSHTVGKKKEKRIASLALYLGLQNHELHEIMKFTKTVCFHSWKIQVGVYVQTEMHEEIAWVVIDEIEDVMVDWGHIPKEQMHGKFLSPA
eukprot:15367095-Ditylum_brightwellii.AAC.1